MIYSVFCLCFAHSSANCEIYKQITFLGKKMAPPSYADIGKQSRDVFGKGYHFGLVKLDVKTKTTSGVEFNAGGTSVDGKVRQQQSLIQCCRAIVPRLRLQTFFSAPAPGKKCRLRLHPSKLGSDRLQTTDFNIKHLKNQNFSKKSFFKPRFCS